MILQLIKYMVLAYLAVGWVLALFLVIQGMITRVDKKYTTVWIISAVLFVFLLWPALLLDSEEGG